MRKTPLKHLSTVALGCLLAGLGTPLLAAPPVSKNRDTAYASKYNQALLLAAEDAQAKRADLGADWTAYLHRDAATDSTLLEVVVDGDVKAVARELAGIANLEVRHVSANFGRITVATKSPAAVLELGKSPSVRRIDAVIPPATHKGIVTTQDVRALRSAVGANKYGVTGRGEKVGILSDSFAVSNLVRDGNTTPPAGQPGLLRGARNQDSGDLPPVVQLVSDLALGSSDEGAGMAELVHDIAPGADIAFHAGLITESFFADGILALAAAGCSIIVDDIIFFEERAYQHGPVARAAKSAVDQGIPYFTSAGNSSNRSFIDTYRDINPDVDDNAFPPSGNDLHMWSNGTAFRRIALPAGELTFIVLHWNQPSDSISPGNGSQIDLDLYLCAEPTIESLRQSATPAAIAAGFAGVDPQGVTGQPFGESKEIAGLLNPNFETVNVYVAIEHNAGNQEHIPQSPDIPLEFRIIISSAFADLEGVSLNDNRTGGPTSFGHETVPGVFTVGAVPWYDTPEYDVTFAPTLVMDPQDFTALGGNFTTYFDESGNLNPVSFHKPDFAATNGGNTTFFGSRLDLQGYEGEDDGFPNFFGTSAASPNAAAVAALMRELNPDLSPAEIGEILTMTAIDVVGRRAGPGIDATTGAGLINAEAALDEVARRIGVTPIPTPTPVPDQQNSYSFPFASSSEGWEFQAPPGFTAPGAASDGGRLAMTSSNNTNSFGWWRSPLFRVGAWAQSGDMPLLGDTGANSLYRMTSMLSTNVASSMAPVTRIRTATDSFEQSDVMVISSTGDGSISPTTSGRQYRHYFGMPATQSRFRSFVDLMNFDPADSPTGAINVESSSVEVLSTNFFDGRLERTWDFTRSQARGWTVRNSDAFASPFSKADEMGLRFGPAFNAGATNFSFWGSPESDPLAIALEAGRLYRAVFTVASNATNAQKAAVPAFRLRVNDASNKFSAYVNVESTTAGARVPTGSAPQQYTLWFEAPPLLSGSTLNFSFDYLLVPEAQNDGAVFLYLSDIRVDSYLAPF